MQEAEKIAPSEADLTHSAFSERLRKIVDLYGGPAEFARSSGSAQSSIQYYLRRGEPTRPVLAALAKTGKISIDYLATGHEFGGGKSGPSLGAGTPHIPDGKPGNTFQDRVARTISETSGLEATASKTGLTSDRLQALQNGAEPTRAELIALGQGNPTSIYWLTTGIDFSPVTTETVAGWAAKDVFRALQSLNEEFPTKILRKRGWEFALWSPVDLASVYKISGEIIGRLLPAEYTMFEVNDNNMAPVLSAGDVAVVRRGDKIERPGLFLFKSGDAEFLAHVAPLGDSVTVQFGKQNEIRTTKKKLGLGSELSCLGAVSLIIKIP